MLVASDMRNQDGAVDKEWKWTSGVTWTDNWSDGNCKDPPHAQGGRTTENLMIFQQFKDEMH